MVVVGLLKGTYAAQHCESELMDPSAASHGLEGQAASTLHTRNVGASSPPAAIFIAEPERLLQVRQAFVHAMDGYSAHAWGEDELDPINMVGLPSYRMGLTIIDSMDTMWLMGLHDHFNRAVHWINNSLIFRDQQGVNVFEVRALPSPHHQLEAM